jgi:hypothetical protein
LRYFDDRRFDKFMTARAAEYVLPVQDDGREKRTQPQLVGLRKTVDNELLMIRRLSLTLSLKV